MNKKLKILICGLSKFVVLFLAAVYLLTLPFFGVIIAFPSGTIDALFPYEFVLCVVLSGVLFAWSVKTVLDLILKLYDRRLRVFIEKRQG